LTLGAAAFRVWKRQAPSSNIQRNAKFQGTIVAAGNERGSVEIAERSAAVCRRAATGKWARVLCPMAFDDGRRGNGGGVFIPSVLLGKTSTDGKWHRSWKMQARKMD